MNSIQGTCSVFLSRSARRFSQVCLADFCLWGPATMLDIGSAEGDVVAYCSKEGHGTRLMPEGTIQGMQLLTDGEAYMMTGIIDQTKLNIVSGDFGGELDSGGQDGVSVLSSSVVYPY